MPLPKERFYTSEDYWNLPEGQRAELIDGQFYDMAPPSFIHQTIMHHVQRILGNYIAEQKGSCVLIPAPFAINLDADDKNWVEPDISIVCDKSKITGKSCKGAPDLVIEVVSPSSRKLDYSIKNALYASSGVREYWVIDPERERTMVFFFEEDAAPTIYNFFQPVPVGIFKELSICISNFLS